MKKMLFVISLVILASCGALKESGEESTSNGTLKEYEESFRPSDHDQSLNDFFPDSGATEQKDSASTIPATPQQSPELTQGYRVQVFATSSYDDATSRKATAEGLFPDEWFYVVYDAPTYKIRAGNFLERYEADRFAKLLAEKGYRDAWVVPERVYQNPLPRAAQPQEMQK